LPKNVFINAQKAAAVGFFFFLCSANYQRSKTTKKSRSSRCHVFFIFFFFFQLRLDNQKQQRLFTIFAKTRVVSLEIDFN
jgi:hypothetical protein